MFGHLMCGFPMQNHPILGRLSVNCVQCRAKRCAPFPNWWLWCKHFSILQMMRHIFWSHVSDARLRAYRFVIFLNYHIYSNPSCSSVHVCDVHSNHVPAFGAQARKCKSSNFMQFFILFFRFGLSFLCITQLSIRVSHLLYGACYKMTRRCLKSSWIITLLWAIVHVCYADVREIFIAVHFSNERRSCADAAEEGRMKLWSICSRMSMWLRAECSSNSLDFLDDDLHEHSINFKHFIVI